MPLTISYPNIQHFTIPPSITLVTVLYFFFTPLFSFAYFLCYFFMQTSFLRSVKGSLVGTAITF